MAAAELLPLWALDVALLGALVAARAWRSMVPCRPPEPDRNVRGASNFGLLGIGVSTVGMVAPAPLAALGSDAETRHWGVFHRATMPSGLVVFVSVLVMGLGKDLQP